MFSELCGSVAWCLINLGDSQIFLLQIFFLLLVSLVFPLCVCKTFCICPTILGFTYPFLQSFFSSVLEVSIDIYSSTESFLSYGQFTNKPIKDILLVFFNFQLFQSFLHYSISLFILLVCSYMLSTFSITALSIFLV